tara:strand:- start:64 stop:564 length:501 start_codon:yes stop_codon:yes gene_type:complete
MKKFLLSTITLMFMMISSCQNPSLDEGFERLNKSFAELEAAFAAINIDQMEADIISMNDQLAQMILDVEQQNGTWAEIMNTIENIKSRLEAIVVESESWATSEDMADLLVKVKNVREGIETLVLRADYDYDGVINAIDKCPDTPLTEINNVDAQGCAPGETPEGDD